MRLFHPQNGPVVAEDAFASYDDERGNINATLNFVVPAALMTGLLRFIVDVEVAIFRLPRKQRERFNHGQREPATDTECRLYHHWLQRTQCDQYRQHRTAGADTRDLSAETSWAMTTYPVSGVANVRVAGTFVTNTPLNDPRSCPGCCSPNWQPLLQQVAALVAIDQAANPGNWVYYGIVAGGIPVNVPGCNGWGGTGGLEGQPQTYAHEIGHQFGLPHARCGNAGNGNPNYPVYEPYDLPVDPPNTANWTMASIGEYGLDINNGAIANPNDAEDFMSYCGPRWMSLFTYQYLTNLAQLTPQTIPTGSGAAAPRLIEDGRSEFERDEFAIEPMIHMFGVIDLEGKIEVSSVARIATRYLRGRGRQTG